MNFKSRYGFLQNLNFETLYNTFLGLESRERIYALVGTGVLILLIIGLPISLASSTLGGLEESLQEGQTKQREIVRELENYQTAASKLQTLEERIKNGYDATLTTTLATLAAKSNIKERLDDLREKGETPLELFDEIAVEVKLTKITLSQLMDYLYNIEHHPQLFLKVKQLQLRKRYDNSQLMDALILRVATYKLQTEGGQ